MKTYLIQVQVLKDKSPLAGSELQLAARDFDRSIDLALPDQIPDDHGCVEIRFSDAHVQERLGKREPDIFFELFKLGTSMGTTQQHILWNQKQTELDQTPPLPFVLEDSDEPTSYSLKIHCFESNTGSPAQPLPQENIMVFTNDPRNGNNPTVVVDALPALDQIVETGRRTSVVTDTSTGGNLENILDSAFSQTLGSALKINDPKAFEDSLTRAFVSKEMRGRTVYEWLPTSYAATADLGGKKVITGAQASLYYRAKATLDQVLTLLNQLMPLNPASDKENSAAVQAIIRTELNELVNELGYPGGPRVQRVDQLFRRLLGSDHTGENDGELARLAKALGLTISRINTLEEEQNFSDFLILRDYTTSLHTSWENFKEDENVQAYLGPQLVELSRALEVVGESVRESWRIMDLFFLGPAERDAVYLEFLQAGRLEDDDSNYRLFQLPDNARLSDSERVAYRFRTRDIGISDPTPLGNGHVVVVQNGRVIRVGRPGPNLAQRLTIEELLSWTLSFATEEGPQLAREGGKVGITEALEDTAFTLMVLVQATTVVPTTNTAFQRQGVVRSLQDLATHLAEVFRLAGEIELPDDLEL